MAEKADPQAGTALRRGWTTGACATAAAKAATEALQSGQFPDSVEITLPSGQSVCFALAWQDAGEGWAEAGVIKDAGDDPDVTHGALVKVRVEQAWAGSGLRLVAGEGVGLVTKPGLPTAVGEAAITPVPRDLITRHVTAVRQAYGLSCDLRLTLSVPGGAALAQQTWNPRLGVLGGLSILGTTGVVVPYSCAAWIHAIHRGVDVALAAGLTRLVGATGHASERAAQQHFALPDQALLDMGDFVGALLKYLRHRPCRHLIIAGGFAKMSKLAQGHLDLHSSRSQLDLSAMAAWVEALGGDPSALTGLKSGGEVLARYPDLPLGQLVAERAHAQCKRLLDAEVQVSLLVCNRQGQRLGLYEG